jgi:hypothetical protein
MSSGLISDDLGQVPRLGLARMAVIWAALIAFALQSYVTQTHFHHPAAHQIASVSSGVANAQAPTPPDEETACPLCHAVAAAGVFIDPAPSAIKAPTLQALAGPRPPVIAGVVLAAASFAWRSRAPPQI